jgi:hypothetical protein
MPIVKQTAEQAIRDYIESCGGVYSNWYVGIACDPRRRLFVDHNVDEENGRWIFQGCESSAIARDVEEFFVDILGTKGGAGGGDLATRFVYAYKITLSTKE